MESTGLEVKNPKRILSASACEPFPVEPLNYSEFIPGPCIAWRGGGNPGRPHSFGHTVSAWGKEAGLELEDVKTLLRHENIATTSEIYGHWGLEAKRRIQQRLINFAKKRVPATIQ